MQLITALSIFLLPVSAQISEGSSQAVLNYVDEYKPVAIQEMLQYKIPASITLAQGILESGAGLSELAQKSNNHFGIKCHDDWKGDKIYYDDDTKNECFRKYGTPVESYRDHSVFLTSNTRYANLFELDITDYKGWAQGLKKAGYATNPKYDEILIKLIEDYNLSQYDKMTLADVKEKENSPLKKENKKNEKENNTYNWNGYANTIFYYNRIPTLKIKEGDTPEKLAKENKIRLSMLLKYNDIQSSDILQTGTNFYLQPKRKKGADRYHIVQAGESMQSISRDEGILLEKLYERNQLQKGQEPATGEKLNLKGKRKNPPLLANKKQITEQQNILPHENKTVKTNELIVPDKKGEIKTAPALQFDEDTSVLMTLPENKMEIQPSDIKIDTASSEVIEAEEKITTAQKQIIPVYYAVQPKETLYGISKKYNITVQQIKQWNNLADNTIKIGQKLIVGYK